jgi:methionyl-tRNA formyltransferase
MASRVVFFGNERIATGVSTTIPTLQALIAAGYEVAAVVSNYEAGTSRSARQLEVQSIANAHNIPMLLPDKPTDILEELRDFGAEIAVLVAYGRIVPQSIIDLFPRGIVNLHPSLLPLHRGPTPIESVILHGETKTGVSIMCLEAAMDAGPIYGQSEIALRGDETKQELADTLLNVGSKMLIELLPGILDGYIIAKPQNNEAATYDKLIKKEDGRIDLTKPARVLEREIRAFAEWPKSYTTIAGTDVIITKAHIAEAANENELAIKTGKDYLIIDTLKPAGKNEMTAAEFLRGYGKDL